MDTLKNVTEINTQFLLPEIKTKNYCQSTQNFGIKYLIKTINGGKAGDYGKDFMKIRFESDDNLPLGRIFKASYRDSNSEICF